MSKTRRYGALLVLLATLPALAWAGDFEQVSAEPARFAHEQATPSVDAAPVTSVAIEAVAIEPAAVEAVAIEPAAIDPADDPLLYAEFDEEIGFGETKTVFDPFEKTNRVLFKFNRGVHRWFLSPITKSYQFVVPSPARQSVRRALVNLNSPSILVNDLLQLRFKDAGETFGRFVLNSTIGMGGLFDVGVEAGWRYHTADFGQTLARIGVVSGPYLVVPILGPNTLRDGVGDIVDIMFQPLTYLMGPTPNLFIGGGRGFAELEAKSAAMEALEGSSVDYYAALRSAYIQNRRAEVELPDDRGFE